MGKLKNATNEQYIKYELIKPQMNWAGTVVVLIGKDTAKSDYVNWEIKTAAEMGKRIGGVFLRGAKEEDVPAELNEYGNTLIGWNGDKIVRAINGEDLDWEKPDGTPRDYGFAPNPYFGYCTLATCKPVIRRCAGVGDWIAAFGAAKSPVCGKLVALMRVEECLSFDEYWEDERFKCKRPVFNKGVMHMYGDNIYHHDKEKWVSGHDGSVGICQWRDIPEPQPGSNEGLRRTNFFSFADDCNVEDKESIQFQANFILEECNSDSPYKSVLAVKCFKKLNDEELTSSTIVASDYVTAFYEGCFLCKTLESIHSCEYSLDRFDLDNPNIATGYYYLDTPKRRGYTEVYYKYILDMYTHHTE